MQYQNTILTLNHKHIMWETEVYTIKSSSLARTYTTQGLNKHLFDLELYNVKSFNM